MGQPRFKPGDRVRVIRQGPSNNRQGVVREVEAGQMLPQYLVEFEGNGMRKYLEFDLQRVLPEAEPLRSN